MSRPSCGSPEAETAPLTGPPLADMWSVDPREASLVVKVPARPKKETTSEEKSFARGPGSRWAPELLGSSRTANFQPPEVGS